MADWRNISSNTSSGQNSSAYSPNAFNAILSGAGAVGGGIVGGGVGGALGLETGPGALATGYAGGVAGAGAGAAAGNATADFIRFITGDKSVNFGQTAQNTPDELKSGAIAQAVGGPLARILGVVSHPISSVLHADTPFFKGATTILNNSNKTVDISKTIGNEAFSRQLLPQYIDRTLETPARTAYNEIIPDVISAAKKMAVPNSDIASTDVSMPAANLIKSSLQKRGYETGADNMTTTVTKDLARMVKKAIETQEPGVKASNAIATALHTIEEPVQAIPYLIPGLPTFGRELLRRTGGLPQKVIQSVLPEGGGYLQKLLPFLLQGGQNLNRQ